MITPFTCDGTGASRDGAPSTLEQTMQLTRIWLFAVLCTVLGAAAAQDAANAQDASESPEAIDPELATCQDDELDTAIALVACNRYLEVHPDPSDETASALYVRSFRYPVGPLDKARADLDRAIEIAPQWGSAYARRAELRFDPKQPKSALDDITTAIAFDSSAAHYAMRAWFYLLLDHQKLAASDLENALYQDSKFNRAYMFRATLAFQQQRYGDAVSDILSSLKLDPQQPWQVLWLHLAMRAAGDSGARAALEQWAEPIDLKEWPGPLLAFQMGKITAAELQLAAASEDPMERQDNQCSIEFFALQGQVAERGSAPLQAALRKTLSLCTRKNVDLAPADQAPDPLEAMVLRAQLQQPVVVRPKSRSSAAALLGTVRDTDQAQTEDKRLDPFTSAFESPRMMAGNRTSEWRADGNLTSEYDNDESRQFPDAQGEARLRRAYDNVERDASGISFMLGLPDKLTESDYDESTGTTVRRQLVTNEQAGVIGLRFEMRPQGIVVRCQFASGMWLEAAELEHLVECAEPPDLTEANRRIADERRWRSLADEVTRGQIQLKSFQSDCGQWPTNETDLRTIWWLNDGNQVETVHLSVGSKVVGFSSSAVPTAGTDGILRLELIDAKEGIWACVAAPGEWAQVMRFASTPLECPEVMASANRSNPHVLLQRTKSSPQPTIRSKCLR